MFLISCSIKLFFSHTGSDNDRFWSTDPLTGTFYQINFQSALTWHQARQSCEQQDAELLSVTEIHEQTYLRGEQKTVKRASSNEKIFKTS